MQVKVLTKNIKIQQYTIQLAEDRIINVSNEVYYDHRKQLNTFKGI